MLFSIIVAHFNNNRYLPDLIESVLGQTYSNWELIIVDDCSDEDPKILLNEIFEDKRIKYFRHHENLGAAAAFKTAIEHTAGDVIGMLGGDDALLPTAIEKMLHAHVNSPGTSLINSNCYFCDNDLNVIEKYRFYRALLPGQRLIDDICIGSFATFKRSAYYKTEGFDIAFKKALDHDIYLKLEEVGNLGYIDEPLYLYRSNPDGISQQSNGILAAQYSIRAKLNAYERRLISRYENIDSSEAHSLWMKWYLREMYHQRVSGYSMRVLKLAIGAVVKTPSIFFQKSYWSNIIRAMI